jgi:N-methylhydantoinase A/oxoprolinase/acetone carboxylase beta subunit
VTDANLVLGRIPAGMAFGDLDALDVHAAAVALDAAGVAAADVVAVVNANMEQAVRHITVERGVDPEGLALVAFGGAGPLHACDLADALGMAAVVVPARAGVLSAVGLLCAPRQRDLVRSWATPAEHDGLPGALAALGEEARSLVGEPEATVELAVDARYRGQSHELTVPVGLVGADPPGRPRVPARPGGPEGPAGPTAPAGVAAVAQLAEAFAERHRAFNGFDRPGVAVEVIALRARATGTAAVDPGDLPVPERRPVVGPCVVVEADCTIWVPDGWAGTPGGGGALVLRRTGGRP